MTEKTLSRAAPVFPAALAPLVPRFLASLPYDPRAYLIEEVVSIDRDAKRIVARMDTTQPLPFVDCQRGDPAIHPRHVNGGVIVHATGMLGCTHAFFLNGLRFDEGWIGFGARIHRGDFKSLARIGPPLELVSVETRLRASADRQVARYEFRFSQEGRLCYFGEQTATWLKGRDFDSDED